MRTEPTSARPSLLKPSDFAAQLGVSRSWLYEAAKTGRIPSIRVGGEEGPLRFVPADIQRWIERRPRRLDPRTPDGPYAASCGPGPPAPAADPRETPDRPPAASKRFSNAA